MQTSRRSFLQTSVGIAAGLAFGRSLTMAADTPKRIPIGFQLYTVRGEFSRDVPGTLKALAKIGYRAVEFWGYSGTPEVYQKYSAKELRKLLDENGLQCCGIHLDLKALAHENFHRTMESNQTLGGEYLTVAGAEDKMGSEKGIAELADILNNSSTHARNHKQIVGYHAHNFDFKDINGRPAWDVLFSKVNKEVNMQMDVGNCLSGKGDPIAMLKKFPGRTWTIHIKEHEDKTFETPFYQEVFRLCETTSDTKWYIVEMGGSGGDGFEVPRQALEKLKRLGK